MPNLLDLTFGRSNRIVSKWCLVGVATLIVHAACSGATAASTSWFTDYAEASAAAERRGAMLLVLFFDEEKAPLNAHFERAVLQRPEVARRLERYVCVKLPIDARIRSGGKDVVLLEHASFSAMEGHDGVAILDYENRSAKYYGCVVSALPFTEDQCYSARQMQVILELPPGMPEQRMRQYVSRVRRLARQANAPAEACPSWLDGPKWLTDYAEATRVAEQQKKMLLIYFRNPSGNKELRDRFERGALSDPDVVRQLADFVLLRVSIDAEITIDGKPAVLMEQPAFREMLGQQGIAILDFASIGTPYHSAVVSTFPLTHRQQYGPSEMKAILTLPPGTLTQRTLIYAVRTHPERPASANGQFDPTLAQEATQHSEHQARIGLQGHHQWGVRFHRINRRLPAGLTACEVCAESWPGENLLEAAIECVRCWRHSSGHWSAVRAPHRLFGYDMKRGSNGVWYATGIFGRH